MRITIKILKLSLMLVVVFILFSLLLNINSYNKQNSITAEIPSNAIFYVRISPTGLLKDLFLYSVFDSKDVELYDKINIKVSESKNKINGIGIDLSKEFEVIILHYENEVIPLIRFTINNRIEFESYFKEYNYFSTNSFGYLTTSTIPLNQVISNVGLKCTLNKDSFISILEFSQEKVFHKSEINLSEKEICASNTFYTECDENYVFNCDKGIIGSLNLTQEWQKLLEIQFDSQIEFDNLQYISFNYHNLELTNSSSFSAIPIMDLILKFNAEISIHDWLTDVLSFYNIPYNRNNDNQITINNKKVFIQEIDENCFLISMNEENNCFIKQKLPPRYLIGDISSIIKIENIGLYSILFSVLPGYSELLALLTSLDHIKTDMDTTSQSETYVQMKKDENLYENFIQLVKVFI